MNLCKCGCSQECKNLYVHGHNSKHHPYWLGKSRPEISKKMSSDYHPMKKPEYVLKISGKNNYKWNGGSIGYWHAKARKYFFTGYCEICGMSEEEHLKEYKCKLHMHNTLNPKDYKVMNPNAWMCICNDCHQNIENPKLN